MMQRLVVRLTQALGHRLDRLAPPVQHQPAQVALAAGALIGACQRRKDVIGEGLQASTNRGQFGWCEATHSLLPLCMDREDESLTPYPPTADLTESY
jgi:hypothetical protein